MTDQRFYHCNAPLSVTEICRLTGVQAFEEWLQSERLFDDVASLAEAGPADICFWDGRAQPAKLPPTKHAGVCLIASGQSPEISDQTYVLPVSQPKRTFLEIAQSLISEITNVDISPFEVGPRTSVHPSAYIGPGVQIGSDCEIGPHASIRFSLIGNNVKIAAGARLGESGFGLSPTGQSDGTSSKLIPHYGRVIIQDNCSVGANTTIDRGVLDDTIIGEGSQIDNLCHIGHNTHIGRCVSMAAFCGISGSVIIGDHVELGGRAGITDHRTIGSGAKIAAGAAVYTDIPEGEVWGGMPARPRLTWLRQLAWLSRQARKGPR